MMSLIVNERAQRAKSGRTRSWLIKIGELYFVAVNFKMRAWGCILIADRGRWWCQVEQIRVMNVCKGGRGFKEIPWGCVSNKNPTTDWRFVSLCHSAQSANVTIVYFHSSSSVPRSDLNWNVKLNWCCSSRRCWDGFMGWQDFGTENKPTMLFCFQWHSRCTPWMDCRWFSTRTW